MKFARKTRAALLALALAAALFLAFGLEPPGGAEAGVAEASVPERRPFARSAAGAPALDLDRLGREVEKMDGGRDLFASRSWASPSPRPAPAAPAPRPGPPPLPFAYMGKLIEGDRIVVFLSAGERNHVVEMGDTIDGTYRVDAIRAGALVLTYLPLNERQTLSIGSME